MHARALSKSLAVLAAAGVLLTGCGSGGPDDTGTSGASSPARSASTGGAPATAGAGSAEDIGFAQLMIPHHEQAVQMADAALRQASSPQVRDLAAQVKAAQDPQVAVMRSWLMAWDAPESMDDMPGHDMSGMTGHGMMSDQQMAGLHAASGDAFDRMWLEMMLEHHQGAVAMASTVLAQTDNPAVSELAEAVMSGQNQEIATMQGLLGG